MPLRTKLNEIHRRMHRNPWLYRFAWFNRIALAIGFLPSGLTKLLGNRFTLLGVETPVGFFFEALYRSGFYWNFIGLAQLTAALLLVIPRTSLLGALLYFPIITNIVVITLSMGFRGTWVITLSMWLANLFLLCWHWDRLQWVFFERPSA